MIFNAKPLSVWMGKMNMSNRTGAYLCFFQFHTRTMSICFLHMIIIVLLPSTVVCWFGTSLGSLFWFFLFSVYYSMLIIWCGYSRSRQKWRRKKISFCLLLVSSLPFFLSFFFLMEKFRYRHESVRTVGRAQMQWTCISHCRTNRQVIKTTHYHYKLCLAIFCFCCVSALQKLDSGVGIIGLYNCECSYLLLFPFYFSM